MNMKLKKLNESHVTKLNTECGHTFHSQAAQCCGREGADL